jgi:hypothetical protein
MPAIRIDNRDYEEVAVRRIRDTVAVAVGTSALPSGAATEATLVQVRDAIKAQIDLESTIWTDDSGAYYVRRDLVDEGTGTITIAWTTPDGSPATPGAGLKPLASADRDVVQDLYEATGSGTGYSSGNLLARLLILDVTPATPAITELWYNLATGQAIAAPSLADVRLIGDTVSIGASVLPTGAATEAKQDTVIGHVDGIETLLGSLEVDTGSLDTKLPSGLTVATNRLLVDGSGVVQPTAVEARTPTTTSVASSTSSGLILAANNARRGFSIANVSTAKLYLSFSTPATSANCFIEVPPSAFLLLDQQLIVTSAIYGIWATAAGTAQVTEYV